MAKKELYEQGLEEYPKSWIIGQNLFMVIYFALGAFGMYFIQFSGIPILSIAYIIFLITMLVFVLRKHICTSCYYYDKLCHCGWGKLSSCLFKKDSGNPELGGKLAGVTWMLATIIPILGMLASLILDFSTTVLVVLTIFVVLSGINFVVHKKSCEKCKIRYICSGSAEKEIRR
ncbi:hypothetical protein CVT91_02560 [Candidatus Atribacteria bacterium HGW-Atribacteria-1]|nr:MAG: hypothetical protein CVT91_02560 [Candidatus Atribacteria bacterium HGW-Atribacteria-1]